MSVTYQPLQKVNQFQKGEQVECGEWRSRRCNNSSSWSPWIEGVCKSKCPICRWKENFIATQWTNQRREVRHQFYCLFPFYPLYPHDPIYTTTHSLVRWFWLNYDLCLPCQVDRHDLFTLTADISLHLPSYMNMSILIVKLLNFPKRVHFFFFPPFLSEFLAWAWFVESY